MKHVFLKSLRFLGIQNHRHGDGLAFSFSRKPGQIAGLPILPVFEAFPFRQARRWVWVNRVRFNFCLVLHDIPDSLFIHSDGQRRLGKRPPAKCELCSKGHLQKFHFHPANGKPGVKSFAVLAMRGTQNRF